MLILELRSRHFQSARERAHNNGCRALNVVIEGAETVSILIENRTSVRFSEVFPLEQDVGKAALHSRHKLIDEVPVGLPRDPLVAPTDVLGIAEVFRVVCCSRVSTMGGKSPCNPKTVRSSSVKAVPLFSKGLLSSSCPLRNVSRIALWDTASVDILVWSPHAVRDNSQSRCAIKRCGPYSLRRFQFS